MGVESPDVGSSRPLSRPEQFCCGGRGSIMPSGACTPFSPCTLFPGAPREGEQERVASDLSHCKWEVVRQGAPVLKKWGLQTDRRGGKGHVRILTDIRRKRNMYVCVHAHTHRGPGRSRRDRRGPGRRLWGRPQGPEHSAGQEEWSWARGKMVLLFPDRETTRTRSGGVPHLSGSYPGMGAGDKGESRGFTPSII